MVRERAREQKEVALRNQQSQPTRRTIQMALTAQWYYSLDLGVLVAPTLVFCKSFEASKPEGLQTAKFPFTDL